MTLPTDSKSRKEYPIVTGALDYFPDAIAEVAHVSWCANNKHNPGQELHHSRGKSADHDDCIGRHTLERGKFEEIRWIDENGVEQVRRVRHTACRAWRALAALQEELEEAGAPMARGARPVQETVQGPLIDIPEVGPASDPAFRMVPPRVCATCSAVEGSVRWQNGICG